VPSPGQDGLTDLAQNWWGHSEGVAIGFKQKKSKNQF
jgi:hypothetical protein